MASTESGMANGTSKPGYISSFMSFIENQEPSNKAVATATNKPEDNEKVVGTEEENMETNAVNPEEIKEDEISSTHIDLDPPEREVIPTDHTELDPPAEEVPPTDHTPSDDIGGNDAFEATIISDNVERPLMLDGENTNSSEATYNSDDISSARRNVARRGRRQSSGTGGRTTPENNNSENEGVAPRETPRRAARYIRHYGNYDVEESDGIGGDSDPDYNLSDSDDDPDFNPLNKKQNATGSDEDTFNKPRRSRGRGRSFGKVKGRGIIKGIKRKFDISKDDISEKPSSTVSIESTANANAPKRRGRPPTYAQPTSPHSGDESIVSSTDDKKSPSKLSSSYNYAPVRTQRPNVAIRLPEGPQLTPEQLELVESQFKSGDFVMAKKDMDQMEHPPIWRIDGKSLLQKFQAFEKDGKTLYRNISTYSGWTSQAKALYVGVKVTFVLQSRYDTVVEMIGLKSQDDEDEPSTQKCEEIVYVPKNTQQNFEISEEMRSHMPDFEIYLQTLISQALDNNFLKEIYEENDDYFVERVKVIDDLAEERKKKIVEIVEWNDQFKNSLDTWPCINVMITKNADTCQACSKLPATKLSQLYGQPYNQETLRSREPMPAEVDTKNYEVCDRCSNISQMYNKVSHQKYDYYSQCKSTVTNMRVTHPSKHTTTILRDLLANDHWIMGLFRSMCTTWIKVDRLFQDETNTRATEKIAKPTETPELT